jgi:hypothetical protein
VIQDGYFYQDYSYLIRTANSVDKYKKVLKDLMHPAGMIFFGEVAIEEDVLSATYQGIPGRIDTAVSTGGLLFRDLLLMVYGLVAYMKPTIRNDIERISILLEGDVDGDNQGHFNSRTKSNFGNVLNRYNYWTFTSKNLNDVASDTIGSWLFSTGLNPTWYKRTNICPDADIAIFTGSPGYILSETGDKFITEDGTYRITQ